MVLLIAAQFKGHCFFGFILFFGISSARQRRVVLFNVAQFNGSSFLDYYAPKLSTKGNSKVAISVESSARPTRVLLREMGELNYAQMNQRGPARVAVRSQTNATLSYSLFFVPLDGLVSAEILIRLIEMIMG